MLTHTINIFHYHLLRGGIRSALLGSLHALREAGCLDGCRVRLLVGREEGVDHFVRSFTQDRFRLEAEVEPRLDYRDDPWSDEKAFREEVRALSRWLLTHGEGETLFWLHNATLGKNPLVTAAWMEAAETAWKENAPFRFLHHIHDFPERGRPENLLRLRRCWTTGGITDLYPASANVGYGVLNTADRERLLSAGIPAERVFYMPNVIPPAASADQTGSEDRTAAPLKAYARREGYRFEPDRPRWVLPVRLIRRKNVLESLFLGACASRPPQLLLTLDANSSQEHPYAERVKFLVRKGQLPMVIGFGTELVGRAFSMQELLRSAEAVVSTSLMEGFGFTFLDGPMNGRPLAGRNLSDVTRDFYGVGFPEEGLYEELRVPVAREVRSRLIRAGEVFARRQGKLLDITGDPMEAFMEEMNRLFRRETVDFGLLDLDAQEELLPRLTDGDFLRTLREMNPAVASQPVAFPPDLSVRVLDLFGPLPHAARLQGVVTHLFELPMTSWGSGSKNTGSRLLHLYFTPMYQRPLLGGWSWKS